MGRPNGRPSRFGGGNKRIFIRIALIGVVAIFGIFQSGGSFRDLIDKVLNGDGSGSGSGAAGTEQTSSKTGSYEVLEGARLHEDRGNDGDSFKVDHNGKTYIFRLYFVDAPEKYVSEYNEERIRYQAEYFGISSNEAVEIGEKARDFALKALRQPFRVYTQWEGVYGNERHYAFVELNPDTPNATFLSEELCANGLCRIYTEGNPHPDGRSEKHFEDHLKGLERDAKQARLGGWK